MHACVLKLIDEYGNVLASYITNLAVDRAYLSLEVDKSVVVAGDVVIKGYLFGGSKPKKASVNILLDGKIVKVARTNREGYFEDKIEITEGGVHRITAAYYGYSISRYIYAKASTQAQKIEEKNDTQDRYKGKVDVVLSTKKLEIPAKGGNVLYVTIINEKRDAQFSIKAYGKDKLVVYNPASTKIKKGEQKTLPVYVESDNKGYQRAQIEIEIYMDDELLDKAEVDVFVLKTTSVEREISVPMMPSTEKLLIIVVIFIIILVVYAFRGNLPDFGKSKRDVIKKDIADIIEYIRKKPMPLEPIISAKENKDIYMPTAEQIIY
jgi:hypothetical protein